ncbi:MAG: helix-turn-helix domain-containing protein [Bacteroides sp.]|nr:helix-turn-helix domain-containing protein [Bacteroides sp.]MCM1379876.1 helix-turn-helix domain-containing protein [Bacteroides sp.]MCM1446092.1 helix-turn-helix domain-containing protein [Prevotella sp.]
MESHGIGSTQFADSCGIPRPTLSQILSGRNKKISDAVIAKIHNAYPQLSVLWLLFGEGQMETGGRISAAESQIPASGVFPGQPAASYRPQQAETMEPDEGLFGLGNSSEPLIFDDDEPMHEVSGDVRLKKDDSPTVTIPADGSKSIVNIMVFYSDNSFQSFIPR